MEIENKARVKSLYKCFKILECFSSNKPELGITEIGELLGLTKSNVHKMISTLVDVGYVEKDPLTCKYKLSLKMLEFSYIVTSHLDFQSLVLETLQGISNELNLMAYFGVLYEKKVLYLYNTYPKNENNEFYVRSVMGETAPLYCTSLGKAILSTMNDDLKKQYLDTKKIRFTKNSLIDDYQIIEDINLNIKNGYSFDNMEHENGISCIGVPVIKKNGTLLGAISISGPSSYYTEETIKIYSRKLIQSAYEIRSRL